MIYTALPFVAKLFSDILVKTTWKHQAEAYKKLNR